MTPVPLLQQPHSRARKLASSGAPVFLIVNPVEYHGPHLPLHTDELISRGIARDLHQGLAPEAPFLLGGVLEMGVEPVPGPGSRAFSFRDVRRAVVGASRALVELGAKQILVVTFHGSPLHNLALQAGVAAIQAAGGRALAPLNLVLSELLELDVERYAPAVAHIPDEVTRRALLEGLVLDYHGGFFETSLVLHYAPDSVDPRYTQLASCDTVRPVGPLLAGARLARSLGLHHLARELHFAAFGAGWYLTRPFRGYTGRPQHAHADAGAWFAQEMAGRGTEAAQAVLAGTAPPPPPIMRWMSAVTMGGLFGMPGIPSSDYVHPFSD